MKLGEKLTAFMVVLSLLCVGFVGVILFLHSRTVITTVSEDYASKMAA